MDNEVKARKMEFVFARIHFEGLFSPGASERVQKILLESEKNPIKEGRFMWAFGDIDSQTINHDKIIFGRLGRTVIQKFETIYDELQHSYKKELIKSREAAYSNFFIVPGHNILAFEERYNLGRNLFIKRFKAFWSKHDDAEVYFEFLKDEVEIFDIIKEWDRLTEASFDLVPSNPASREDYRPIDEVLGKAHARRAKLKFENKDETLSKKGSIIQQGMSMSADGYGEFKLKGFKGKTAQIFNSITKLIKREIQSVDDLKAVVGQVYQEITKISRGNKRNGPN